MRVLDDAQVEELDDADSLDSWWKREDIVPDRPDIGAEIRLRIWPADISVLA